ncbi:MAG: hypothetical protein R8M14_02015 [Ghiorsea sp.]
MAFAALIGLLLNLSFSGNVSQPDWSLSILLAILLSQRKTWYWILPLIGLHDLLLFWSVWITFPFAVISALLLSSADVRLSPGQYQRWLALLLACSSLLFTGVDFISWLLTITLSTWIWSILSVQREKAYVEPA